MPRYNPNPAEANAGFPLFRKGDYRFKCAEPKAFDKRDKQTGNVINYGIGITVTCVGQAEGSDMIGKKQYVRLYLHTPEARDYTKQFQMAVFGFTLDKEEEFNKLAAQEDWSFDTDTGAVGSAWKAMTNKEFIASMSIGKYKDPNNPDAEERDTQQWDQYRPIPIPTE